MLFQLLYCSYKVRRAGQFFNPHGCLGQAHTEKLRRKRIATAGWQQVLIRFEAKRTFQIHESDQSIVLRSVVLSSDLGYKSYRSWKGTFLEAL